MKILICDDEQAYTDTVCANIKSYLDARHIPHEIRAFTDSSCALEAGIKYDMAFLDIEMSPISGIELAKTLKKQTQK